MSVFEQSEFRMFISLEICFVHKIVGREILHFLLSDLTNTVIRYLITLLPERKFVATMKIKWFIQEVKDSWRLQGWRLLMNTYCFCTQKEMPESANWICYKQLLFHFHIVGYSTVSENCIQTSIKMHENFSFARACRPHKYRLLYIMLLFSH